MSEYLNKVKHNYEVCSGKDGIYKDEGNIVLCNEGIVMSMPAEMFNKLYNSSELRLMKFLKDINK